MSSKFELPNTPNTFHVKENYDATRNLVSIRSQTYKVNKKELDETDPWKRRPIDFTWRLYQPDPPKRYFYGLFFTCVFFFYSILLILNKS
jgi:hypothetical protein